MAAFFTTPSQGVSLKEARSHNAQFEKIFKWLASDFKKPTYPGLIDMDKANRGKVAFEANCSSCHGYYRTVGLQEQLALYPNKLVPNSIIESSAERMESINDILLEELNGTKIYADNVDLKNTKGYVASILSGV
jgi:mono/diheme cytochrome c family protein